MRNIYEFKSEDAFAFANHVHIQAKQKGNELNFIQCPYCRSNKDKGTFSINLETGVFKCLRASCGAKGNMVTLSQDFDFSLGLNADVYYKRVKKEYKKLPTPKAPIIPKEPAIAYLETRGISKTIAEKYEITTQKDRDNVLVFPFYDEESKLQFVKYRKTDFDKEKDNAKEWCEANCKPILFGMKQCSGNFKSLIMNEGQCDSLAVATAYDGNIDVVSVPTGAKGFTWLPYCWDWINKFQEIIVFGDYEKGHITLLDDLKNRLKVRIKHVREEDYLDCKDANDILRKYGKEQIKKCIENAIDLPMDRVIDLADVEDVDIFKLEKLATGFKSVDRLLYGGIPFGGVVLLTGKSGCGKSTIGSQILVNAREQGYKCFAYSGELPNYLFRAWINFQVAGTNHIYEYENKWGDKNYNISDTNKKMLSEWYRDYIFLYDNSMLDGDEKESLVETCEKVIMRHGIKVILLDNLMTAIDLEECEGSDKYEKQSQFIKKLTRLALRHNVLIMLVAHKRKNNVSTNENDEVAGSSDIGNLALMTLTYEKQDDIPKGDRLLKISKNRLFGKVNTDGYVMHYDEKSKRSFIDGENETLFKEFSWNKDISDDTPFD